VTIKSPIKRTKRQNVVATAPVDDARPARPPQQDRGLKRVESILDAAEAVVAEVGVEAASTNAIAERAGSSVGSLYHFFPSKEAIIEALARRFAERKREVNAQAIPVGRAHMPLEEVFERVVESHARFLDETPAFIPVYDSVMRGRVGFMSNEMLEAIVGQVRAFLAARAPHLSPQERETSAMASVSTIHGVLLTAMRLPRDQRAPLLSELKRMMVAYFEPLEAATREKSSSRESGRRDAPRARRRKRSTRKP
jgi:AcrR family transcriptional regulator